jgi:hypothetical protein
MENSVLRYVLRKSGLLQNATAFCKIDTEVAAKSNETLKKSHSARVFSWHRPLYKLLLYSNELGLGSFFYHLAPPYTHCLY